jgi:uncharacterized membrane protein YagU involved in acid resistance
MPSQRSFALVVIHIFRLRPYRHRLLIAIVSGALATAVNMAMLAALRGAGVRTAHGGLLRLFVSESIRVASFLGMNATYRGQAQPFFTAEWFHRGFHILTGLLMAVVYVFFLEPRRGVSPLLRAILYGIAVWLLNSLVVLPAIGEGIAGMHHLNAVGISGFAAAHLSYFLVLCLSTSYLRREELADRH